MVRIDAMADRLFRPDRRKFLAGTGAALLQAAQPGIAASADRASLTLQATSGLVPLRPGQPDTAIWSLQDTPPDRPIRFRRGDELELTLRNELPVPAVLSWRGLDGVPLAEPLAARPPLVPGRTEKLVIPLRQAGTMLCDLRLLGDNRARPSPARALIVTENEPIAVDRDEVFMIEDWRLRPNGDAIAPGVDPTDTIPLYTVNRKLMPDITARPHERVRFRFINGCQRAVIALKIDGHLPQVMALDSQPAEPFPARNGTVLLAPGGRADTFVDANASPGSTSSILLHDGKEARPVARLVISTEAPLRDAALPLASALPSNGLPSQLDLKNALRFDLTLGRPRTDWMRPADFEVSASPAFRVRTGRTVVLALTNGGDVPIAFHLHGHHFRLLDRLDDGWKPFWLDTLAFDAGQTQRVAFLAGTSGRWLVEWMATDWAAPRFLRWYSVE
jgi:FtsP/CotA-like multicopper oxidase with cupredoxin domain